VSVRPTAATAVHGGQRAATAHITSASVWRELARQSFAVFSHVNAAGEPRSSGVVYGLAGHRLYVVVAADGWKARHVATGDQVALTVPVRRGGVLALLFPIPPATISFHARATVHPAGSDEIAALPKELTRLLPEDNRASSCVIELVPEGQFLTYGLGVSLLEMREPALARAHLPVA
jgi:Pyridoxamine 5'-phosphate oxidase